MQATMHRHLTTAGWVGDAQEALGFDARDTPIVEAAAALFLERSIAQVKMTDVAERSGVGVATIYRHFATKTKLAIAAGTLMWTRFNRETSSFVETEGFLGMSGRERLEALFAHYCDKYAAERPFMRFLDEFDHLVVAENIAPSDLECYGAAIDALSVVFLDAYELGRADGSIAREVDFELYYRAFAHAFICVAEKLARGRVIPSDSVDRDAEELACLVDGAMRSLVYA